MKNVKSLLLSFVLLLFLDAQTIAQNTKITELITHLNSTKEDVAKIPVLKQIGLEYQKVQVYKKAIAYYQKAYNLEKKYGTGTQQRHTLEHLAHFQTQTQNYSQAINLYEQLQVTYQEKKQTQKAITALIKIGDLYKRQGNYAKAIDKKLQIITLAEQIKNTSVNINAHINAGFLYKKMNEPTKSMAYYNKALALSQTGTQAQKKHYQTKISINQGVAYSQAKEFDKAQLSFNKALNLCKAEKDKIQAAHLYNYMAASNYIRGKNNRALNEVKKAVEIAQNTGNEHLLATSYEIIAKIYAQEEKFKDSQRYYQLRQTLHDKLKEKERLQEQAILQKEIDAEKTENNLRQLLADKDRQEAALKQARLEKEKQEKELALLRKNRALEQSELKNQQLEKQRIEQLLALSEQKALSEKRKQETERQKLLTINERVKKEKAEIAREKAEADKKTAQKAKQAVEAEKALQDQQLKQEKQLRYYGLGILALGVIVLVLMMIGFINIRKTARKLRKKNGQIQEQKNEIVTRNEELRQQQEELAAQRDFAALKSSELDKKNQQMTKSIIYASNIQTALLPTPAKLTEHFPEHFIIFHPKDIVSGDFYWFSELDQQKVLAVVDCTGHGVPGAFMSMIGNTVLNEIVNEKRITDPAIILEQLHSKVREGLKQHSSKNTDGMDVCLCRFTPANDNQTVVTFSGAKRNLYYVHKGKLAELKGDRVSIGGYQHEKRRAFTNAQITLDKGDSLYLTSDGFVDSPSPDRKSFGSKRFGRTIEVCASQSMKNQRESMEDTRKQFQQDAEQRDDILVIGVRV